MNDPALHNSANGLDTGNVTVMLGMLECIHDEVDDDEVMVDFAATIQTAIGQLRTLQSLAYETMIEIESERALARHRQTPVHKKTH